MEVLHRAGATHRTLTMSDEREYGEKLRDLKHLAQYRWLRANVYPEGIMPSWTGVCNETIRDYLDHALCEAEYLAWKRLEMRPRKNKFEHVKFPVLIFTWRLRTKVEMVHGFLGNEGVRCAGMMK